MATVPVMLGTVFDTLFQYCHRCPFQAKTPLFDNLRMNTSSPKQAPLELNLKFVQVLYLASWPSRLELTPDTAVPITRICALLARRPSVGMLIPVMLDMDVGTTYALLQSLYANGHIYPAAVPLPGQAALAHTEPVQTEAAQSQEFGKNSFLGRLWQRLTDRK